MTIQTIIDKFYTEFYHLAVVKNEISGNQYKTFKQFLKDSLISMLDGIEKEAKDLDYYTQTTLSSGKKVNLVSKEEVINIIKSHR